MTMALELREDGTTDLGTTRVVATSTSLRLKSEAVSATMAELAEVGRRLGAVKDALPWWIGDWFVMAETTFGSTYTDAEKITGLGYQALADIAYVCRAVDFSRRRENLSFTHHREVAPLAPWAQVQWLDVAESEGLSAMRLRARIAGDRELPEAAPAHLRLTAAPERAERWKLAAERAGVEFDQWAADALDKAAA